MSLPQPPTPPQWALCDLRYLALLSRQKSATDGTLLAQVPEYPEIYRLAVRLRLWKPMEVPTPEQVDAIADWLGADPAIDPQRLYDVKLAYVVRFLHEQVRQQAARPTTAGAPPPLTGADRGAGQGGTPGPPAAGGNDAANGSASEDAKAATLRQLEPVACKAYLAFGLAQEQAGRQLQDREAYALLKELGLPPAADRYAELTDYQLPALETWARYLRIARQALGEQKHTRRAGRPSGNSIATPDQIERPRGSAS
jgi:hypothetical protein